MSQGPLPSLYCLGRSDRRSRELLIWRPREVLCLQLVKLMSWMAPSTSVRRARIGMSKNRRESTSMPEIATIGLDIAKNVFQLHGVDRSGKIVLRKALRRSQVPGFFSTLPPCLIGVEACATAHHWARTLIAFGHE